MPSRGALCGAICLFLLSCALPAHAHIGSPNVFFEGTVGEYPVRVVIRPPAVVPGLADISVRVAGGPVDRITVLPVFWNAGRKGAPPPDQAKPVRGESNLYSAALWLMKSGTYSVDVHLEGARGAGTLVVPVDAVATNTRPMSPAYTAMLTTLGLILCAAGIKIAGTMARESGLDPGQLPTQRDRWRGRAAMALAAMALAVLLFGGKRWWDYEDRDYRNNSLYRPQPVSARERTEHDQPILDLTIDASKRRGQWTPLIPDHGKMMHLFLVRDAEPGAFAHLHPLARSNSKFEAALPPLPAGSYHVYADVTHENGFSETLTTTVQLSAPTLEMKRLGLGSSAEPLCSADLAGTLLTNLFLAPDMDDSWQISNPDASSPADLSRSRPEAASLACALGGGYQMTWEKPGPMIVNRDTLLRFTLRGPDAQPATLEPYMGMAGHAVVRRRDGSVFAHIHPVGTFSMAAQEFFIKGKPPKPPRSGATRATIQPVASVSHDHTNAAGIAGDLSFPYAFPAAGDYRIWVQARTQGRILTGVFDATVEAAR